MQTGIRLVCMAFVTAFLSSAAHAQCDTLRAFVDDFQRVFLTCYDPTPWNAEVGGTSEPLVSGQMPPRTRGYIDHAIIPLDTQRFNWYQHRPNSIPVIYIVRPKETSFRIARLYFDMPIEALMMHNNLPSTDLGIGQKLIVGWYDHITAPDEHKEPGAGDLAVTADTTVIVVDPFGGEFPTAESGTGYWDKSYPDDGFMFAMHRDARINSLIEITNPMFSRSIMVKVIGRIPTTYRKDIDIIVSPAVARKLGIIDSRFYVRLRYLR